MKQIKFFWLVLLAATILLQGCIISSNPAKGEDPVIVKFNETKQFSITVFPPIGKFTWSLDGVVVAGATGNTFSYTPVLDGNQTHILKVQTCLDNFTWNIETPETSFFDDFNDGNADGWIAVTADAPGSSVGDWRVEDGMVKEYSSVGDYKFLRDDLNVRSQIVESKIFSNAGAGWGGITLWYENFYNWVDVLIYPGYNELWLIEVIEGISQYYKYPLTTSTETWYLLKIRANNSTGELTIYLDDEYVLTHTVTTTHRTGRSGFTTGNNGGNFDDFRISWGIH